MAAPDSDEESGDKGNIAEKNQGNNENGRENQVVHTKSVSIKGVLKGVRDIPIADDEIEETDIVTNLEEEEVLEEITEEKMQKVWDEYAASMKKEHPRIFSTLKQHLPTMKEPGVIEIQLNSNAQRDNFLQNIKPGLLRYFQQHLGNIEYVFKSNLIEGETMIKKVYTDQDKLDYLINKNKELEKLKTRFNLDFDG